MKERELDEIKDRERERELVEMKERELVEMKERERERELVEHSKSKNRKVAICNFTAIKDLQQTNLRRTVMLATKIPWRGSCT